MLWDSSEAGFHISFDLGDKSQRPTASKLGAFSCMCSVGFDYSHGKNHVGHLLTSVALGIKVMHAVDVA